MTSWHDRWRQLFPRRTLPDEIRDEIEFHIEERVADLVARGVPPERARRQVLERFGDVKRLETECQQLSLQRIERTELRTMVDLLWHDLATAARALRARPAWSAVVILTLALGIGATTAVFSVVDGLLLRPLPYPQPDRLVLLWQTDRATGTEREAASLPDYVDFRERATSLADLALYTSTSVNLTRAAGEPSRVSGVIASHNLLGMLGVAPALGRDFLAAEDQPGAPAVALLGHRLWVSAFDRRADVLGTSIDLNEVPYTIVGVLPPGLDFPTRDIDVWTLAQADFQNARRSSHTFQLIGRLNDTVQLASARDEIGQIAADLEAEYPANANRGAFVEPLQDFRTGDIRTTVLTLFAAVASVLLIACANVANLLLALGAARQRETAVCLAMGASLRRLARRYLAESLILVALAMGLGCALALAGVRALLAAAPSELRDLATVQLDTTALAFAMALSAAIAIVFSLLPTFQARRINLQDALKQGRSESEASAASGLAWRRLLVTGQVAVAVVLLVVAGLLFRSLENLTRVDPGFSNDNILRLDLRLPASRYSADFSVWPNWPDRLGFYQAALAGVGAIPGVESVALGTNHPLDPGFTNSFSIAGREAAPDQGELVVRLVTPGYFATVGTSVIDGHAMDPSDDAQSEPVALVNQATVDRYFRDEPALGQSIALPWDRIPRRIVGVLGNEKTHGLTSDSPPTLYVNILQVPSPAPVTLLVRTQAAPLDLVDPVRRAIWNIDAQLPLYNVTTMAATLVEATARERFTSLVLVSFSGVALFLAALGLYGLLSYLVAQRRHELGVRLALGATNADVVRLVGRQGLALIGSGLVVGLGAAVITGRWTASLLYGLQPLDPITYLGVVMVLAVTGLLASVVPARRAAATQPVESLRGD